MLVRSTGEKIKNNSITIDKNKENITANSWQKTTLTGYTLRGNQNNKLTLVNNGVKIGKGVKRIKVNGTFKIRFSEEETNTGIYISKNGSVPIDIFYTTSKGWVTHNLTSQIFEVVENDIISCVIVSGISSNNVEIDLSYMTIEIID